MKYYSPEYFDNLCLGWVGGLMNTFPMLALGDELHRERVIKTFDFVIPAAQGKSGYFLAALLATGNLFAESKVTAERGDGSWNHK